MSDPLHAANCPCFPCHTQRNPRALAPAMGPVVLAPEPLYPRGPDNTSDDTDAELDGLRARVAELEDELRQSCTSEAILAGRIAGALRHHLGPCECEGRTECVRAAIQFLKGVR